MDQIMAGEASPAQIAAFAVAHDDEGAHRRRSQRALPTSC